MDDFRGKIWVFEDIIDLEYQEKIKQTLLSHETNWFYNDNINVNSDHERRPCFSHVYYDSEYDRYTDTGTKYHENNRSHLHDLLVPLIDSSCKAIEYNYKYIITSLCSGFILSLLTLRFRTSPGMTGFLNLHLSIVMNETPGFFI